jgi:hypothetical protein
LNKGLQKCTGDIFNWINSDDYLEPGALHVIANLYSNNPSADIFCGYSRMFENESNKTILLHRCKVYDSVEETIAEQKHDQQGMFYKLEVLKKLGGINNNLHYVMDFELWLKYLVSSGIKGFVFTDKLVAHFRMHSLSKTISQVDKFKLELNSILFFLSESLTFDQKFTNWYSSEYIYYGYNWQFKSLNKNRLMHFLLKKNFYLFIKDKNYYLARKAFISMCWSREITFNSHYFALFLKLFIADIPIRKLFR